MKIQLDREQFVKWVALLGSLILVLPFSAWLRGNPSQRLKLWILLGFLPFVTAYFHLYMAIDSTSDWGGYVKGAEVSGLDLVALCLYMSLPGARHSIPFRFSMAFYFLATVLSALQALSPTLSLFYPWQLGRMFLVYATVERGCEDQRVTWAVMKGMAVALIMEAGLVIWQRFGSSLTQTAGTLGHQNLLGMMSHLVALPFFALLLTGRRGPLPIVVILAGIIVDISTASRATIGLSAFGFFVIFMLSAIRNWTPWKARVLLIGTIAMAALAPAAIISLQHRFEVVPLGDEAAEDSYDERGAYKAAATMMLSDHPLGVGANHFSVIGNVDQYYDRAKLGPYTLARAGNVHNIYYLVAAETGYLGLIALLIFLSAPLIVAFRCGRRSLNDDKGNLLLGLAVAILTVYLHSWEEWILITFSAQYLMAVVIGLIAANAQQLNYWQPTNVRRVKENQKTAGQLVLPGFTSKNHPVVK